MFYVHISCYIKDHIKNLEIKINELWYGINNFINNNIFISLKKDNIFILDIKTIIEEIKD